MKNHYDPKPVFALIADKLKLAMDHKDWEKVTEVHLELQNLIKS